MAYCEDRIEEISTYGNWVFKKLQNNLSSKIRITIEASTLAAYDQNVNFYIVNIVIFCSVLEGR